VPERPAVPKRVTILDTMPTTPIGKIYKPTLRAMAAQTKMIAVIQPLGLPDGIKVQCSAQTRGVVAEIAIPASFSDDQIARLKETVGSLPLQIDFIHG
jgi:fatty-acyl-CoA synthase